MAPRDQRASAMIISFSGIDGAGKSTQIRALEAWLARAGLSTTTLSFWDDVVVNSRAREFMSRKLFGGDQGIGTPDKPVQRRDKNVSSMPVTIARLFLYLADAMSLRLKVRKVSDGADVLIFDRYIYDELANLPSCQRWARAFIRALAWLTPQPDLAYVIDADPDEAIVRKPEYPLDFLDRNRQAYLALSQLLGTIKVIEPLPPEAAEMRIRAELLNMLPAMNENLPFCAMPTE
jgi:thymidylate kinase